MAAELVTTWNRDVLKPVRDLVVIVSAIMLGKLGLAVVWLSQYGYFAWHWWMLAQLAAAAVGIASAGVAVELLHRLREQRIDAEIEAAMAPARFAIEARSVAEGIEADVVRRDRELVYERRKASVLETSTHLERHAGVDADDVLSLAAERRGAFEQADRTARLVEETVGH